MTIQIEYTFEIEYLFLFTTEVKQINESYYFENTMV